VNLRTPQRILRQSSSTNLRLVPQLDLTSPFEGLFRLIRYLCSPKTRETTGHWSKNSSIVSRFSIVPLLAPLVLILDDLPFSIAADGLDSAGLSYLRVPLGASDFSDTGAFHGTLIIDPAPVAHSYLHTAYTFASPTNDGLASFSVDKAPAYLFSTIKDIKSVNPGIKVHLIPWSPVSAELRPVRILNRLPPSPSPHG